MNILLITEDSLIEEMIISSRLFSKYKIDKAVLSINVSVINLFKYDIIIISFVPSYGTPYFGLIKSLLRLNKKIVSINLDQNKFSFDYKCRIKSYRILCKLGLMLFSLDDNFNNFLKSIEFQGVETKKISDDFRTDLSYIRSSADKKMVFVFDLRWITASREYIKYKRSVGYSDHEMESVIKFSSEYFECFLMHNKSIMRYFNCDKAFLYIDGLASLTKIEQKYYKDLPESIEQVDVSHLLKLFSEDTVILTNWHTIELVFPNKNLEIYRIDFLLNNNLYSSDGKHHLHLFVDEKVCKIKKNFDILHVEYESTLINIDVIYSDQMPLNEKVVAKYSNILTSMVDFFSSFLFTAMLIGYQLRFLIYNAKVMLRNIAGKYIFL